MYHLNIFKHTNIVIYYCYCYCFFSSEVNYAEFENYNEVEVEDEVTNSEEHPKPTDKSDDQIC